MDADLGLFILRIYLGVNFLVYGSQKLFGAWNGPGIENYTKYTGSLGLRPAKPLAVIGGLTEFGAGLLMLVGFAVPLAAAGIIGDMIVAIRTVHWKNGYFNAKGGYTYNLSLIAAALCLAFAGPGAFALGPALGLELAGMTWGIIALVVGVVVAGIVLAARRVPEETAAS